MEQERKLAGIVLNIAIPLLGIYLVCFWGPKLLRFFLPFVIGWILAMIASPLVKFLERRLKLVRRHGSILVVVGVLAALIGLIYLAVSRVIMLTARFSRDLQELYAMARQEFLTIHLRFAHLLDRLPEEVQQSIMSFTENVGEYIGILIQKLASPTMTAAGNVALGIPNALVHVVITILSSYFFIVERDRILEFGRRNLPKGIKEYYQFLKRDIRTLIGGYFLAQFRIMFIVALVMVAGFFVLGVNYGVLWALLIAFLDFLPIFGTGTVLIPWAVIKLLAGEYTYAMGLGALYVLTQVVRQLIQPKIVGDAMGLPPLLTLLFLFLGYKAAGLTGMILAVPFGLLGMNLYRYGIFDSLIANGKALAQEIQRFRKQS